MNTMTAKTRVRRWWITMAAALVCCNMVGCTLCCSPYDDDYGTFGTRTPRLDMKCGRVGSALSDPALCGRNVADQVTVEEISDGSYDQSYIEQGEVVEQIDGTEYESDSIVIE